MVSLSLQLTKNFRLYEFIYSDIAWSFDTLKYQQLETASENIVDNIRKVAHVLQSVRDTLELPIYVNSGYRSKALNDKLREMGYSSHPQSKHLLGRAADVRGKDINTTRKIWNLIKKHKYVDTAHSYCKSTSKSTYIHFQLLPNV